MLKEKSVETFLDELASKAPTPGGGGAAAIMGAMGAALVSMVCNLTVGKKNYLDVEEEIKALLVKSEDLRVQLQAMVADDKRVFDQVMAAYGLPRDSDEDKARRTAAIQEALKEATDVPLACARLCGDVIELSMTAAEKGNLNVISDAGVAVMAAYAGLKSAALNVDINTGNIKDKQFAEQRSTEIKALLDKGESATREIYDLVHSKL